MRILQAMMDRDKKDELPKMQVGFIDAICLPIYQVSKRSMVSGYCRCSFEQVSNWLIQILYTEPSQRGLDSLNDGKMVGPSLCFSQQVKEPNLSMARVPNSRSVPQLPAHPCARKHITEILSIVTKSINETN